MHAWRSSAAVLLAFALGAASTVYAATLTMAPGDTVHCPTVLVSSGTQDAACATPTPTRTPLPTATPAPSQVWLVPLVSTNGYSTGYQQYCDNLEGVTLCGTYPAKYAFTCANPSDVWKSRDDDSSGWNVHFATPTAIAGFRFKVWAADTNPSPTRTWSQGFDFRETTDVHWGKNPDGTEYVPAVAPFFQAEALNIPDRVWTQYQWLLPAPVTVSNLRMDFDGQVWATTQPVYILTSSSTPKDPSC